MNPKREWLPNDYLDEMTPPWRASPDAWIEKIENGAAVLAPCADDDSDPEAFRLTVKLGDVVQFCWQELVAEIELSVWPDRYELETPAPAASTWNRVGTSYAQGGFVEQSVDKIVEQVREGAAKFVPDEADSSEPERVTLFFYLDNLWTDSASTDRRFRLIDAGGAYKFVPEAHVQ